MDNIQRCKWLQILSIKNNKVLAVGHQHEFLNWKAYKAHSEHGEFVYTEVRSCDEENVIEPVDKYDLYK
jgi:hypothetical protein